MGDNTESFQRKTKSDRLWEHVYKLVAALSFVIGGAMIRNEIVDARQSLRLELLTEAVKEAAPLSLQNDVKTILGFNQTMLEKLTRLETKMERIEQDNNANR